jgi:hypothetical protein
MYDPLGLSVGTTNLVAVRAGESPVTRRSVLTLFEQGPPEVGVPGQGPTEAESGQVVNGFVERVGDSGPVEASDGSNHDPDLLLVEALNAMVGVTGADTASSQLQVAFPAHWSWGARGALQGALAAHPSLRGRTHSVSDAAAALTALAADPGLPNRGVIALLDFGGSGTSITLADAGSGFEPIDQTRRYPELSGSRIDEALLAHVVDKIGETSETDPGETTEVGQLSELRAECTKAKEQLSLQSATDLVADPSGVQSNIRVTRTELERLIEDPLSGFLCVFEEMLERNTIRWSKLAAVAAVGGGANIPLITQRLSSRRWTPVVASQHPALDMATGAALMAARTAEEKSATPTALAGENTATQTAPAAANTATQTAPAANTATQTALAAGGTATQTALATPTGTGGVTARNAGVDRTGSASSEPELAWSQEDSGAGNEPVLYADEPYTDGPEGKPSGPSELPSPSERDGGPGLSQLVLGASALVAVIAVGGVAYTLTNSGNTDAPTKPSNSTTAPAPPTSKPPAPAPPPSDTPSASSPEPPPPPPPVTTSDELEQTTGAPEPTTTAPEPATTAPEATTTAPEPTTTAPEATTNAPPPATTTAAEPTAAAPEPTNMPSPTPTTAPPAPTTPPPPAPTTAPMTTDYLTIPFVPVPIPVQVPGGQGAPPQNPFINPGDPAPQNPAPHHQGPGRGPGPGPGYP